MRRCLVILLLTVCALAASPQADPVSTVKRYYELIGQHLVLEAYDLRSAAFQKRTTPSEYEQIWATNLSVAASGFALAPPATVHFTVKSLDYDRATGARENAQWNATAKLVKAKNLWYIEDIQVEKVSSTPVRGLELAPGETSKPGKDPLPTDIPVYTGFRMSDPLLVDGKRAVLSTNRQKNVQPRLVSSYYEATLKAAGWTTEGPAGGGTSLTIVFKKGERTVLINIYQGLVNGTDIAPDPRGARLEIFY